jgi:hypothetical protein
VNVLPAWVWRALAQACRSTPHRRQAQTTAIPSTAEENPDDHRFSLQVPAQRPERCRLGGALAAGAIIGAILPALAGLVLLGSAVLRRPVLGRRIFSRIDGAFGPVATWQSERAAIRLTLVWGAGLVLTGLVQGLTVLTTGASVTDPAGMLTRTLVGLAGEALLAVATLIWLSGPQTGARARRGEAAPPVSAADVPVPAPESADGPRPSE